MPLRYIIHKEQRLVLTVAQGRVTLDELAFHRNHLLRDPHFNRTFNQLCDFTSVTNTDVSGHQIKWFAERTVFSPTSRRAIVVSRPLLFGLVRQFEVYHGERAQVQVFYNWTSALRWVGLHDISSPFL